MNRIVFNGREFSSPDEMPPDVRRLYDDVMASMASTHKPGGAGEPSVKIRTRIVVNGKEYSSVHDMPESIRAAYEKFVAVKAAGGNALAVSISSEAGSPKWLDAQLRLSVSTRLLISLAVAGVLAALFLWR